MDKDRARLKALDIIDSGTAAQRIELMVAELDRRDNNWAGVDEPPLLTAEETEKLMSHLSSNKIISKVQAAELKYARAIKGAKFVSSRMLPIARQHALVEFYALSWADAEELETAVNIVLRQIADPKLRMETAVGLAKQIDHRGCCQSVTPDGLLVISSRDILADNDLYTTLRTATATLQYMIGCSKAYIEAIDNYMSIMKLKMPATKKYLISADKQLAACCLMEKYRDRQQMRLDEDTSKNLLESGKPLLYDRYRLMPKYEDIEPQLMAKKNFYRTILMPTEDEAKRNN